MNKKITVSLVSFLLFLILGIAIKISSLLKILDKNLLLFFSSRNLCQNRHFWQFVTFFANKEIIVPLAIVLFIAFFLLKKKKYAIFFISIVAFSEIIKEIFKFIFQRQRPAINQLVKVSSHYSFPSGHTLIFFVFLFFAFLPFLNNIKKKIAFFIWIIFSLAVGLSRVCLQVHWLFDVLGSFFLGIAIIEISLYFLEKYDKNNKKTPAKNIQ